MFTFSTVWLCGTCGEPIRDTWFAVIKRGKVHHREHFPAEKLAKLPHIIAK